MPDHENDDQTPMAAAPRDWNEAFAALPVEAPGNEGWQRLTRALDDAGATAMPRSKTAAHRRARWPLWLATAAAVSALALLPLLHRSEAPTPAGVTRVADTASPASPSPETATTNPQATAATSTPSSTPAPDAAIAATATTDRAVARRKSTGTPTRKPAPVVSPSRSRDNGTRIADAAPTNGSVPASTEPATATDQAAAALAERAVAIQSLQAESAQLEALVALARDDRVSSASGAAIGVELDARIGRIDASLSQPGLTDAERADLWHQRVAAMRELAGIETTQRWLVTQGERYDGALVSVD